MLNSLGEKLKGNVELLGRKVEKKKLNSLGEKLKGNVELLGRKVERKS